jgi:histone H1/5
MIKEAILAHPEESRNGLSRPTIKKFLHKKHPETSKLSEASFNNHISKAIARGAAKATFLLPKGPSGKVKLAPSVKKVKAPAAKKAPAVKKPAAAKKPAVKKTATTAAKKPAVKKTATKTAAKKVSDTVTIGSLSRRRCAHPGNRFLSSPDYFKHIC